MRLLWGGCCCSLSYDEVAVVEEDEMQNVSPTTVLWLPLRSYYHLLCLHKGVCAQEYDGWTQALEP